MTKKWLLSEVCTMPRKTLLGGSSLIVQFLVFSPFPALAQTPSDGGWMWGSGWGGMMFGGGILMLVFWGGIILLIVLLARGFGGFGPVVQPSKDRPTALDVLKERYARGEIDKQDYEERRKTLGE